MNDGQRFVIWESASRRTVATRVAIAGDFLPAGDLLFDVGETWTSKADALADTFSDVDTTFVNCESSVGAEGLAARKVIGIGQTISAAPASLDYLKAVNVSAAGIANNHTFDFGGEGVRRTCSLMRQDGIEPVGICTSTAVAPDVYVYRPSKSSSLTIGFWAAAKATRAAATGSKAGVEPAKIARGRAALTKMKSEGAGFCIALLHAGSLRTNRMDPEDVRLIDALAHAGFDLVAASHSHRISGHAVISQADGTPAFCLYGLGSIVSGYIASKEEREGLVVAAGFDSTGDLATVEVRPVSLDAKGFGATAQGDEGVAILRRFRELSREFADGSFERMYYDEISSGLGGLYLRDMRAAFHSAGWSGLARKARRVRMRHVKSLVRAVVG